MTPIWYRPAREPGKIPIWYRLDARYGAVYTSDLNRGWHPSAEFYSAGDLDKSPWCYRVLQVGATERYDEELTIDIDL